MAASSAAHCRATDEPCFATDDELEAWAADYHVGFELETSAEILAGQLVRVYPSEWHLRRVLCTKSLGEVGSLDAAAPRVRTMPRLVQATAVAAAAHLAKIAAEVEAGLVEERIAARTERSRRLAPAVVAACQELRAQLAQRRDAARSREPQPAARGSSSATERDDRVARGDAGARPQLHGDAGDRAARVPPRRRAGRARAEPGRARTGSR